MKKIIYKLNKKFRCILSRHNLHRTDADCDVTEAKPPIVNQHCAVYHFVCDLCDADYVGYTARHLFQRVAEHKNSAIVKNFHEARGRRDRLNESHFKILRN